MYYAYRVMARRIRSYVTFYFSRRSGSAQLYVANIQSSRVLRIMADHRCELGGSATYAVLAHCAYAKLLLIS